VTARSAWELVLSTPSYDQGSVASGGPNPWSEEGLGLTRIFVWSVELFCVERGSNLVPLRVESPLRRGRWAHGHAVA
jgi:hypothetical protein